MALTINNTVFTSYVNEKEYEVNAEYLYTSWTDANGLEHRTIYKEKVNGTIVLEFWNNTDYGTLITALGNATEAYVPVTLFVNNLNASKTCNMFVKMQPTFTKDMTGTILKWVATLTVEEC